MVQINDWIGLDCSAYSVHIFKQIKPFVPINWTNGRAANVVNYTLSFTLAKSATLFAINLHISGIPAAFANTGPVLALRVVVRTPAHCKKKRESFSLFFLHKNLTTFKFSQASEFTQSKLFTCLMRDTSRRHQLIKLLSYVS